MSEILSENNRENSDNYRSSPNFSRYASGTHWVPIPKNFFIFVEQGFLTHYQFSLAILLWQHTYFNNQLFEFALGRSDFVKVTRCGRKQAKECIDALTSCGALILINSKPRTTFTYRWNVENLKAKKMVVSERYKGLYPRDTSSCIREIQGVVSERYSIYIEFFIESIISSYNKSVILRHNVDKLQSENSEEQNSGAFAPFSIVENKKVAEWISAGKSCGETYGHHHVHLVLSHYKPLHFDKVQNPLALLTALLSDASVIYELKKNYNHFQDENEFGDFMGLEYRKAIREEITKVKGD